MAFLYNSITPCAGLSRLSMGDDEVSVFAGASDG